MKLLLFFIFFIFSGFFVVAQNSQLDSLFRELKTIKTDNSKSDIYFSIAKQFQKINRQKSFHYAKLALDEARNNNQKIKEGEFLNYLGDLYWYSGDYKTSSENYFEAFSVFDELNSDNGRAVCYRNIGWIYQGQNNYDLTLTYYYKSLALNKKLKNTKRILANYDDLSIVYFLKEDYSKAELYCNKTIDYAKQHNFPAGIANGRENLAEVFFALGKTKESIENHKIAVEQFIKLNDFYNIADSYNGMSNAYLLNKEYQLTIESANKSLEISKKHDYKTLKADSYYNLSKAFSKINNFDEAYNYLELYTAVKDSTFNETNAELINEMSAKYEFQENQLLIKSLKGDKALSDARLEQEQKTKLYLMIFSVTVMVFTIFLVRTMRQRKKVNASLTHAYEVIELKNKDITDSITYSKKIQQAMLPPDELRDELFNDIFIYFQPKDIVSGDFYWYAEKNGVRIVAACDCTGHGVPGALMSMIGTNILNQIINENGITTPNEILISLNNDIKKALRQNNESSNAKDGMDLALVSFIDDKTIEYSGANRPLWIVRNNELIEIKPSKFAIGGMHNSGEKYFENHRIELQKNDCLYIFTDGLVDQFGGPIGKKFMSKKLRNVLLSIHHQPMKTQHLSLQTELENWKGSEDQIDDILFIGIRV